MTTPTPFQISALPLEPFLPLFSLTDDELLARGARRCVVDAKPGYPCRVSLRDAEIGEKVILLTHTHHPVDGPYQASGPIYVRESAEPARLEPGEVPEVVGGRLLSLRAYNAKGLMRAAEVFEGHELEQQIERLFADPKVAYLHVHNARPGCFSCRVDRVDANAGE